MTPEELEKIAENTDLLEIGRQEIENTLIELRDARISFLNRGNGLVCREFNGESSDIIRMGPETALRIGLKAIAKHMRENECPKS